MFIAELPPQLKHGWKQLHVYLQVDGEATWVPSVGQDGVLSLEVLSDIAPCAHHRRTKDRFIGVSTRGYSDQANSKMGNTNHGGYQGLGEAVGVSA